MAKASNSQRNNADKSSPLPEKIAVVLQESRWLALVVIAGFLSLALWGYDRVDPGWSHAAQVDGLRNPAGRFGAWLADLLLYLFGVSAWWWVALLLGLVWWGYRRLDGLRGSDRRPLYIAAAGFLVLLVASCGLESLRFYTLRTPLPLVPGGMLGLELGTAAERVLGYTGATMVLLAGVVLGWSLFSGMSWLTAFERLGGSLEMTYGFFLGLVEKWQDRRIGREVAREREAVVEVERARVEDFEPVRIEIVEPEIQISAKVEKRIEREIRNALPGEKLEVHVSGSIYNQGKITMSALVKSTLGSSFRTSGALGSRTWPFDSKNLMNRSRISLLSIEVRAVGATAAWCWDATASALSRVSSLTSTSRCATCAGASSQPRSCSSPR